MSEANQILAIEQAIDEIVTENVLGIYRKVTIDGEPSIVSETLQTS